MLRQAVLRFGTNWELVRDMMGSQPLRRGRSQHRSSRQCYERHRKLQEDNMTRSYQYVADEGVQ